ncbi:hypothetical protein E4U55_001503 [Claviceps digitariae]|nr:hypothetical protein E4U55_001503 [Claviceps digitariae]
MSNKFIILGKPSREVPMRVIVHGLHRTGSMSTRTALHQLGLYKCYHMVDVLDNLDTDADIWIRALEAKSAAASSSSSSSSSGQDEKWNWTRDEWDIILGECQACVDLPAALFTLQLADAYPEAKIVLLNRDPEQWYASVLASVQQFLAPPSSLLGILRDLYLQALVPEHRALVRLSRALLKHGMPYDHVREKDKAIAWFNESYRQVRDAIPADRRLEFSVKDGFRPLCAFLDLPVPMVRDEQTGEMVEAPFPHINDRASFAAQSKSLIHATMQSANDALLTLLCKTVTMTVVGYAAYYVWKSRWGAPF